MSSTTATGGGEGKNQLTNPREATPPLVLLHKSVGLMPFKCTARYVCTGQPARKSVAWVEGKQLGLGRKLSSVAFASPPSLLWHLMGRWIALPCQLICLRRSPGFCLDIYQTSRACVTKLSMVVHHNQLDCHVKRSVCCHHEGLCNQLMAVSPLYFLEWITG